MNEGPHVHYKYFVMRHPDDSVGWNNRVTRLYHTSVLAEAEARRLCSLNPDVRFMVGVLYKHYLSYPKTVEVIYEPRITP